MSSMTMNMYAPLIWGFDRGDAEMRIAREAGWRRCDLVWERLMEAANEAALTPDGEAKATRMFRAADLIGRWRFAPDDLRLATTAANLAILRQRAGDLRGAEAHQRRALDIWRMAGASVDKMQILPRSRSSLFHLRMEALHRDTYHGNLRTRIGKVADETQETLGLITAPDHAPHRHFARWRGERPTVYDDTRKVLGACLLIIDN